MALARVLATRICHRSYLSEPPRLLCALDASASFSAAGTRPTRFAASSTASKMVRALHRANQLVDAADGALSTTRHYPASPSLHFAPQELLWKYVSGSWDVSKSTEKGPTEKDVPGCHIVRGAGSFPNAMKGCYLVRYSDLRQRAGIKYPPTSQRGKEERYLATSACATAEYSKERIREDRANRPAW